MDINQYISTSANVASKTGVKCLIDIYNDNWDYILESALASMFSTDEYKELYLLTSKELNVLKRLVNDISLVYKNKPIREAYQDSGTAESSEIKPDPVYAELMQNSDKDIVMKSVNKYTNLSNHTAVKIDVKNGGFDYDIFTFDNVECFTSADDWKEIVAIKYYVGLDLPIPYGPQGKDPSIVTSSINPSDSYYIEQNTTYNKCYVWVKEDIDDSKNFIIKNDAYSVLKGGFKYEVTKQGNQETIIKDDPIPYKDIEGNVVLPFVIFDKIYPVGQRFNFTAGNDVYDMTVTAGVFITLLNQLMKYQSFKQLALIVDDMDKLSGPLSVGPSATIVLEMGKDGGTPDAKVLDMQSKLLEFFQILKERITTVLAGYGVSPQNFTMSGDASSGFALTISNMGKMEAREDQMDIYRIKEREMFNIERIVWNTKNPGKLIDVKNKFKVDFAEIEFPMSPTEEAQKFNFLKMNNAATDIDLIMEKNPEMTRPEAEMKWKENKKLNEEMGGQIGVQPIKQPGQTPPKVADNK